VIGRGIGCDVTLGSLQISRRHATLEYVNKKWFIRDASTNGISIGVRDSLPPGMSEL
jgi:pSer/pThr/pTyr-binding forkhead associated (FHA) protein